MFNMKGRCSNRRGLRVQAPFDSGLSRGIPYSQRAAAGCRCTFALATAAGGLFDDPRAALLSSLPSKLAFLRPAFGGNRTRDSRVISTVLYLSELQNGGIQESNLAGWLLYPSHPLTTCPCALRFQVAAYKMALT